MRIQGAPLFSGTMDEVAQAQLDTSPAHLWPEAKHPGNQWLTNLRGAKRARVEVHNAGVDARKFVRREFQRAGYPLPPYATHKAFRG